MKKLQINLFDRRTVKKEIDKAGIKPVKKMLRITITAIFFERSITKVVEESLELQKSLLQARYTAYSANLSEISS